MSSIKAVVAANDEILVKAHDNFLKWKKENCNVAKTDFGHAIRQCERQGF